MMQIQQQQRQKSMQSPQTQQVSQLEPQWHYLLHSIYNRSQSQPFASPSEMPVRNLQLWALSRRLNLLLRKPMVLPNAFRDCYTEKYTLIRANIQMCDVQQLVRIFIFYQRKLKVANLDGNICQFRPGRCSSGMLSEHETLKEI